MKKFLHAIVPNFIFSLYHWLLARIAALIYGFPSRKMTVIGVTGTNGKSTTVNFIAAAIQAAGYKVGFTTTINFQVADKQWLNNQKMTMLGRFKLQSLLKNMVQAGCDYVVIETSSEGIKQYRHVGIDYDMVVFTNLTPEHIQSHGSFDKYKQAKLKLFKHLARSSKKNKAIVANLDDQHAADFLNFNVSQKIGFTTQDIHSSTVNKIYRAEGIELHSSGSRFKLNQHTVDLHLPGEFNIYNALAAAAAANTLGVDLTTCVSALSHIKQLPGRMEFINQGQPFKVLIDYAPEPESLKQLYKALDSIEYKRLIHVLGSCGGGRDTSRQPVLGQMAATKADIIIITNEDPYDDDPMEIINTVAGGAQKVTRLTGKKLYKILDRRQAIHKALSLAKQDDLVLITGKGAEQAICVAGGKKIPWDDRQVAREELQKL